MLYLWEVESLIVTLGDIVGVAEGEARELVGIGL